MSDRELYDAEIAEWRAAHEDSLREIVHLRIALAERFEHFQAVGSADERSLYKDLYVYSRKEEGGRLLNMKIADLALWKGWDVEKAKTIVNGLIKYGVVKIVFREGEVDPEINPYDIWIEEP